MKNYKIPYTCDTVKYGLSYEHMVVGRVYIFDPELYMYSRTLTKRFTWAFRLESHTMIWYGIFLIREMPALRAGLIRNQHLKLRKVGEIGPFYCQTSVISFFDQIYQITLQLPDTLTGLTELFIFLWHYWFPVRWGGGTGVGTFWNFKYSEFDHLKGAENS